MTDHDTVLLLAPGVPRNSAWSKIVCVNDPRSTPEELTAQVQLEELYATYPSWDRWVKVSTEDDLPFEDMTVEHWQYQPPGSFEARISELAWRLATDPTSVDPEELTAVFDEAPAAVTSRVTELVNADMFATAAAKLTVAAYLWAAFKEPGTTMAVLDHRTTPDVNTVLCGLSFEAFTAALTPLTEPQRRAVCYEMLTTITTSAAGSLHRVTNPDTLEVFAHHPAKRVVAAVARNRHTPPDTLDHIEQLCRHSTFAPQDRAKIYAAWVSNQSHDPDVVATAVQADLAEVGVRTDKERDRVLQEATDSPTAAPATQVYAAQHGVVPRQLIAASQLDPDAATTLATALLGMPATRASANSVAHHLSAVPELGCVVAERLVHPDVYTPGPNMHQSWFEPDHRATVITELARYDIATLQQLHAAVAFLSDREEAVEPHWQRRRWMRYDQLTILYVARLAEHNLRYALEVADRLGLRPYIPASRGTHRLPRNLQELLCWFACTADHEESGGLLPVLVEGLDPDLAATAWRTLSAEPAERVARKLLMDNDIEPGFAAELIDTYSTEIVEAAAERRRLTHNVSPHVALLNMIFGTDWYTSARSVATNSRAEVREATRAALMRAGVDVDPLVAEKPTREEEFEHDPTTYQMVANEHGHRDMAAAHTLDHPNQPLHRTSVIDVLHDVVIYPSPPKPDVRCLADLPGRADAFLFAGTDAEGHVARLDGTAVTVHQTEYTVRVPATARLLTELGNQMGNCVGSYAERCREGHRIICHLTGAEPELVVELEVRADTLLLGEVNTRNNRGVDNADEVRAGLLTALGAEPHCA